MNAILDVNLTMHGGGSQTREINLDRLEGYAHIILDNYDLRGGEIIIISRSGINLIEMAMLAKEMGLRVIALRDRTNSKTWRLREGSKKTSFMGSLAC
jgi:uncharacterized phosphosugar-binding protein